MMETSEMVPDGGETGLDVEQSAEGGKVGLDVEQTTTTEGTFDTATTLVEDNSGTVADEQRTDSPPTDDITDNKTEVVAVPFMDDGVGEVRLFWHSMFRKRDGADAVVVAEEYFFKCFNNDDLPKWDGILLCQYDFAKNKPINDERDGFVYGRDFKARWLWNLQDSRDDVTFNVKCTMPRVWASHFQSFLREMERYGCEGISGQISFMSDGKGNFRPKFLFNREFEKVDGVESRRILRMPDKMFDAG